jgi:hypothetical protein
MMDLDYRSAWIWDNTKLASSFQISESQNIIQDLMAADWPIYPELHKLNVIPFGGFC